MSSKAEEKRDLRKKFIAARLAEKSLGEKGLFDTLSSCPAMFDHSTKKVWEKAWLQLAKFLFPDQEKWGDIISEFQEHLEEITIWENSQRPSGPWGFLRTYAVRCPELRIFDFCDNDLCLLKFPILNHKTGKVQKFPKDGGKFWAGEPVYGYVVIGKDCRQLTAEDVVRNILYLWYMHAGLDTSSTSVPNSVWDKAKKAKKFLLARFRELMEEETRHAEDDFNRACAVSSDGKKIIIADRIISFDKGNEPTTSHRYSLFGNLHGKISKPAITRLKVDRVAEVYQAIERVRSGEYEAAFLVPGHEHCEVKERILIVKPEAFPDPRLPGSWEKCSI